MTRASRCAARCRPASATGTTYWTRRSCDLSREQDLALHTRQWRALERAGGPKSARTPEQDALTKKSSMKAGSRSRCSAQRRPACARGARGRGRGAACGRTKRRAGARRAVRTRAVRASGRRRALPRRYLRVCSPSRSCPRKMQPLQIATVDRALACEVSRPDRFLGSARGGPSAARSPACCATQRARQQLRFLAWVAEPRAELGGRVQMAMTLGVRSTMVLCVVWSLAGCAKGLRRPGRVESRAER